jgi:hypothetical protein
MSETGAGDPNVVDAELVEDTSATVVPAVSPPPGLEPDYTDSGVPSFDFVKDRIESRFTTAIGATEVVGLGTGQDVASLDEKLAKRDEAAKAKLDEIRKSMG